MAESDSTGRRYPGMALMGCANVLVPGLGSTRRVLSMSVYVMLAGIHGWIELVNRWTCTNSHSSSASARF